MKTRVLPRELVCVKFPPIKVPIWNGGNRCVGLKLDRLGDHNEVTIGYKNKDGVYLYPDTYYFAGKRRKDFQVKKYQWGEALIVPIKELEILQRVGDREKTLEEWLDDPRYAKNIEELDAQS